MTSPSYRVVVEPAELEDVVERVARASVIGLDTEFDAGRSYFPRLALVQLASPEGIVLIDPLAVDVRPLTRVLQGPATAVIHASAQDLMVLERSCGAGPSKLFDPQVAAAFLGLGSPSLATLVWEVLGVRLAKGDQLADWLRRPLGRRELDYAASDVQHLLALQVALTERLTARGRLDWALEECERVRNLPREAPDAESAWWRLRGKGKLPERSRGVAQRVAAWREARAMHENRLPRSVLPDLAVLAIAQRAPRGMEQLQRTRGVDGRYLRGGAAQEILDEVRMGLAMRPSDLRLPPTTTGAGRDDARYERVVSLCLAWIAQLADDMELEPRLLGTRDEVAAFARGDGSSRIATGWRKEVLGVSLSKLLAGELSVVCAGQRLALIPVTGAGGSPGSPDRTAS